MTEARRCGQCWTPPDPARHCCPSGGLDGSARLLQLNRPVPHRNQTQPRCRALVHGPRDTSMARDQRTCSVTPRPPHQAPFNAGTSCRSQASSLQRRRRTACASCPTPAVDSGGLSNVPLSASVRVARLDVTAFRTLDNELITAARGSSQDCGKQRELAGYSGKQRDMRGRFFAGPGVLHGCHCVGHVLRNCYRSTGSEIGRRASPCHGGGGSVLGGEACPGVRAAGAAGRLHLGGQPNDGPGG